MLEKEINEIREYVEKTLPNKRMKHTEGVRDTALKLAIKYGCDERKVEAAALLHDVGKYLHRDILLDIIKFEDENKNAILNAEPQIYHGYASAYLAEKDLGIKDNEILNAVKYHTTGKEDMTLLEKIIYIADYIEPNRCFEGVEEVREIAFKNLDESVLKAMDNTIKYIVDNNGIIDYDTILARNYFLMDWGGMK
ncbi:bis(5'-nucleosyl)-tetraphosphatase (symmetrical) YqeK [Oceanirhabdus sp. W0125-5]|uniref:bis(5'-nucleosyl)-tetraphosphatase (symmetrical) YqeK n=1 Tax=Oceanirhabdus sp. W0125-5 TaxID=2999116 RepID=UPI0022F2FF22|nr:bis(5'-nucleosyl)-tetraphosphatase (symmetrical) YqeK [Oceanirhabdus sp. W0125-5]WBW95839.1 bis(5'-nucleosyl)-tetraphosphatase (symmetrical) YqeK [Oceanirhabdus sp. W0125-5]